MTRLFSAPNMTPSEYSVCKGVLWVERQNSKSQGLCQGYGSHLTKEAPPGGR